MLVRFVPLEQRLAGLRFNDGDKSSVIKHIQEQLKQLNFYLAEVHGVYDQHTKEAVLSFQESQHLPSTGLVDAVTFCRLKAAREISVEEAKKKSRNTNYLARANILIIKSKRQLALFNGNSPLRQYPIAIGKPATPTPVGNFAIATKIYNPGGVLGSRWMGLNFDAYGIHGTNAPWFIGQMISNGCIRMHNAHAEDVFNLINVGTPVLIRD